MRLSEKDVRTARIRIVPENRARICYYDSRSDTVFTQRVAFFVFYIWPDCVVAEPMPAMNERDLEDVKSTSNYLGLVWPGENPRKLFKENIERINDRVKI